jgi:electron transport complex protein RnfC
MVKVYSFPRGGISFDDPTVPQREAAVTAFLPGLAVIPLIQHSGGRAYPVVSIGDYVKEGMVIGRGQGPESANVHATVPGKVIRTTSWKAGGIVNDALVIRMEGSFERLGKREEIFPWESLTSYDLHRIISEYGIVEMEGSGRPVADMLSSVKSSDSSLTLVVRCVFDDPWLVADYVLCKERLKAVVEGAYIMGRAGRVSRIVFAVSHGERELGEAMLAETGKWNIPASLALVGSRYPQRNKRDLELVLRNYGKKEGFNLGSLMILGPATLAAVHDAVKLKKPILDRYVAVGGSAVRNPQVMRVRIGKRIGDVFNECGGFIDTPKRIAAGSPLLGREVTDLNEPVVKTSYAVFAVLKRQEALTERNCISCGECRAVCPVGLDPEELYKRKLKPSKAAVTAAAANEKTDCHGCGCC